MITSQNSTRVGQRLVSGLLYKIQNAHYGVPVTEAQAILLIEVWISYIHLHLENL